MFPYFADFIQNTDVSILNWIHNNLVTPIGDAVFPIITHVCDHGEIWIILALVLLLFKKTRKTGLMMGMALILGLIFGNGIIKNVVGRVRPYDESIAGALVSKADLLIKAPHDWAFPSGHTLASFEGAAVLLIRDKRFGIPALIVAILIAFSRLYLYVHFPSDIIGGMIMGIINGILGVIIVGMIWKAVENKMKKKDVKAE